MKLISLVLAAACTLALSACGGDPASEIQDTTPTVTTPVVTTKLLGGTIQGQALTLSAGVTTLAGSSRGFAEGTGAAAQFDTPAGITTDGTNLYVGDVTNSRIRKVVIATGEVSTLAGSTFGAADGTGSAAQFFRPYGITNDGTNLYVADTDNNRIRKVVIATGVVTTLAGGARGFSEGTGAAAQFDRPYGITTDGTNLYVSDTLNHRIRKVVIATGEVTTLAGSSAGSVDGSGSAAQFNFPQGITTDGANLYLNESAGHRVRKIVIATGEVSTVAGSSSRGTNDGTGAAAQFSSPSDITTDGTNLYLVEITNNRVRKIVIATGEVSTVAGSSRGTADGTGAAAQFNSPFGITTDGKSLYVADSGSHQIRKIQ